MEGLGLSRSADLLLLENDQIVKSLASRDSAAVADAPILGVSDVTESAEEFIAALRANEASSASGN